MPRLMMMLVLALTTVAAASSSYTAYKTYLMTDGKMVAGKKRWQQLGRWSRPTQRVSSNLSSLIKWNLDEMPGLDPKVHLILVITAAMWGLLYVLVVNLWPGQFGRPDIAIGRTHVPQVASLVDRLRVVSRTRAKVKAKRKRQRTALAARLFSPSK